MTTILKIGADRIVIKNIIGYSSAYEDIIVISSFESKNYYHYNSKEERDKAIKKLDLLMGTIIDI